MKKCRIKLAWHSDSPSAPILLTNQDTVNGTEAYKLISLSDWLRADGSISSSGPVWTGSSTISVPVSTTGVTDSGATGYDAGAVYYGIKIRLNRSNSLMNTRTWLVGELITYRANVIFEQYDKRIWFYGLYNGFLYVKDDLIPIFGFSLICETSSVRFFSVFWLVDFTCADLIFPRHLSNAQIRPKMASRSCPSSPDEFSLSISPLTSLQLF